MTRREKIKEEVKKFLYKDKYISEHRKNEVMQSQRTIALIAALGFLIMSIVNIVANSDLMLISTAVSSVVLLLTYIIGKKTNTGFCIRIAFYLVLIVVVPIYTVKGGNNGFACLWIIVITYIAMYFIDLKVGFAICTFYFFMLITVFDGPLEYLIDGVELYTDTFRLRFPLLYLINFAFAVYFVVNIRNYQYSILESRQQLHETSITDLNTGLHNRNGYIQFTKEFSSKDIKCLGFVFIDVNGLHELNNAKGHDEGDKMLRFVADNCKKYYENYELFRMGGDEFLAICTDRTKTGVEEDSLALNAEIEKAGYSISYGIDWREDNFVLEECLKSANKIMLDNKAAYYSKKGHDRRARE